MRTTLRSLLTIALMLVTVAIGAKRVHTLGDSTMAPYDENATVTRGWGMYFGQFLTNGWTSVNYAKGGRDSYGGYNELWQTAKKQVEAGDYVIISFAHNDEKNGGMDGYELKAYYESIGDATKAAAVDLRGSIPSTTYKANLRKIAEEALEKGAHPIFVGAVCRSYFSGGKIRRNGRHDLGDSYSVLTPNGPTEGNSLPADDHTMDYTYQMEQLANEMQLPFVNLTQATAELYEGYGDTKCHEMLFDGEGSTHFNTTGALLVARTCAQMMQQQGILADDITIPVDLSVSPMDGDFGQAYKGQSLQKEFTLSGFGLQPESGTVIVTATDGIELSTDKQNWSSRLSVSYQASTLIQTFYAKVALTEAGTQTGTITISTGEKTVEIPVTATAVVLEGGTEVDAYWRLESDDSYTLTGPATVIPQSWAGMEVQRYSNPNANTTWPEWTGYEATRKTQRNAIIGGTWPADEIDDNPERYIQWGIEPADGTTLSIDEISLFACGCGGNGMCSHVYFSTDNFQTRTTMFEMKKMPANNMQYVEAKPVIKLEEGQQLLVRVYPWYNGTATGKTICLSDLHIHGMAQEAAPQEEDPTVVVLPNEETLDLTKATLNNGVVKTDGVDVPQFDSFRNPGSATFSLKNTKAGAVYEISLGAATANTGNTLRLVITDDNTGKTELDKTIDVEAKGWQEFTTYSVATSQMSKGKKTFVINFQSTGGYTSNVNNVKFTEIEVGDLCLVSTAVTPTGAGTAKASETLVAAGTEVTFTATANKGYEFASWNDAEGNILSTENPATIVINGETTIYAQFNEVEILNVIPTTEDTPWVMENGELQGNRANFAGDHHIDYMMNGDKAIYKLNNLMNAAYYDIAFTAGTVQSNVSLNFNITDEAGAAVCDETVEIENNGNWSADSKSYTLRTGAMPKGSYVMTITFNSVGGNGTTANVNNITFTGKESFVAETLDNEPATITFPFNLGTEGQTATFSENVAAFFKNSYVEHGDDVVLKDVNSGQTRFQPVINNDGSASEGNRIDFMVIPVAGMKFVPTKVSFNTTRYGTDGGKVDVSWINSDATTTSIATSVIPARNNATPNVTNFSQELKNIGENDGLCGLRLNLYNLGNTKQVGFSDIVIEGTLSGTTQDVQHYTLAVKLESDEAGKLTITPNATEFDEGDEVTLSIQENFGYHFAAWVDAEGNEVSTANPYTFAMTENTDLTATFNKSNTYALDVTLTEGARDNLVQILPEGTMIDGKRMYEEGQDVKLTALSNKVLTFIGWEDNSTDAERTIRMDGDKQLTANFSADDYIVGWDFYYDAPNQERAADYKSDSENAGLLSLHNANGETSGWLTRGIGNGQENGRYAARIWRLRSLGLYFEASFSTKGYKNIKVTSSLGCSYNTYSVNNLQYSVDGVNYKTVETFNITGSGWFDKEDVALGSDADEQERVYVRWMPDFESALVGNATDYDGLAISDVFITAEAGSLAEEEAVLVSSNPEQDAQGISANGSIILTFDKKIKAGQGVATLAGEEIAPIISGKSAVFKYSGLKYATDYTFEMPEGVLTSRSGNPVAAATIRFTTMERTQPEPRLYDAVVDAGFAATTGAAEIDGMPVYTTVQAAIDAAPTGRALPWLIFIKNGQYKEHVDIPKTKPYIHLIGQTRNGVVIKDDRLSGGDNAVHVSVGATVVVNSDNVFIEGLTMENIWGHEKQAGPQALALNTGGDRIAMNNVRLLSYQDTWITTSTSNNRHYIKNSLIEGAVDFIYNSGNVYLDGDTLEINRPSGGFIVAPSHGADVKWGYVFMNNVLRPVPGMNVTDIWLGRPWHNQPKTVFINLQTYINIPAAGWYETMGGLPVLWADYNTVDANGNPVDLSQRRDTYYKTENGEKVYGKAKNYLTAEEAAEYTLKNVMSGDDNWQPDMLCEACDAPVVSRTNGKLTWEAVPYAICYVVTKGEEVVGFTTATEFDAEEGAAYKVQAVNEFGGLSLYDTANTTAVDAIQATIQAVPTEIYTVDGKRVGQMQRGLNIVRTSDGRFTKVIK